MTKYSVGVVDPETEMFWAGSWEEAEGPSQAAVRYAERFSAAQFKRQKSPLRVVIYDDTPTGDPECPFKIKHRFDVDIDWEPRAVGITWIREGDPSNL